ncbi:hypothetical protein V2A60_005095 [Cordyceps javanica]
MAASAERQSLPSLLDLITQVDNLPLDFATNSSPYYKFLLSSDPRPHGFIHPSTVERLPWPALFAVDRAAATVTLAAPTAERANAALQDAVDAAIACGRFPTLNGLHSEPFVVPGVAPDTWPDLPAAGPIRVERFAATLFGINTRGAHLTAYVRDDPSSGGDGDGDGGGGIAGIWVARRSASLYTYPGMLDSAVAGGVKAGDSPLQCILAESDEEARLAPEVVRPRLRPAGVVTLANRNPRTELVHGEILYVYDLDLSPPPPPPGRAGVDHPRDLGLVPLPGDDGEVDEFILMGWHEVARRMRAGEFKPNVCAVMIDFFIRHGLVTPENEDQYVEICNRLRRKLPMPTNGFET